MSVGRGSLLSALLVLAIGSATAHICMWSPMQRADFNIGEPGYEGCYLKVGPCGTNSTGPITTLKAGQPFSVQFQQNLNHYYVSNPGWMDVSWAATPTPQESDFQYIGPRLVDYNAMNEITQTNFSINVNIPSTTFAHGVLRVRYVSNNPLENDRGEIFYQCADISIIAADSPSESSVPAPAPKEPTAGTPCCAPKQWVSQFYRVGAGTLNPIHGTIYYDAVNKFMRVDTNAGSGGTIYDGSFQMYMNFSNGMEYYYSLHDGSCGLYGLDYWNDWCYGTTGESETYATTVTYGDVPADVWQNGDFYFVNEQKSCLPMFLSRTTGDMTVYYNVNAGIPDPSVFNPPQVCLHQQHASLSVSRAINAGTEVPEHVRWLREVASRMMSEL